MFLQWIKTHISRFWSGGLEGAKLTTRGRDLFDVRFSALAWWIVPSVAVCVNV